jgi:Toprim domain
VAGVRREAKKSATKVGNENTAGRAVIWGDPTKASTAIICEGIETAAAVALAVQPEIASAETMIAACINAGGLEAFKPWPPAKQVIVAADRDEARENGRPATRRGEVAARRFAEIHQAHIKIVAALAGKQGEGVDWLDVLRRDGLAAVREGVLAAQPLVDLSPNERPSSDDEEIARAAELPPLEFDRQRKEIAKKMRCTLATLEKLVRDARKPDATDVQGQGRPVNLPDLKPWDTPVVGSTLLDDTAHAIGTYVIVSKEQADAIALWGVHTHAHDITDVSPHLILKSPQKRCGKSRLVNVVERLVVRPLSTSAITASPGFWRQVQQGYANRICTSLPSSLRIA